MSLADRLSLWFSGQGGGSQSINGSNNTTTLDELSRDFDLELHDPDEAPFVVAAPKAFASPGISDFPGFSEMGTTSPSP